MQKNVHAHVRVCIVIRIFLNRNILKFCFIFLSSFFLKMKFEKVMDQYWSKRKIFLKKKKTLCLYSSYVISFLRSVCVCVCIHTWKITWNLMCNMLTVVNLCSWNIVLFSYHIFLFTFQNLNKSYNIN